MSSAAAVTYAFNVKRAGPSKVLSDGPALAPVPSGRVPRVARLLALADRFQRMLDHGEVASMAEIAKLGRVSRAHVTQIMDLLLLAPDIQEEILCLPATKSGRDVVTLREMRTVCAAAEWREQRERWLALKDQRGRCESKGSSRVRSGGLRSLQILNTRCRSRRTWSSATSPQQHRTRSG